MDRNSAVISVKDLSKTYSLYDSHADRVRETFHPLRKKYHRPFHALSGVSFAVRKGETVGIVGPNGSGKSTLLQVICGILQPTSGGVEVKGRVSALLELGVGFNPQFTGRQNVHLAGSILGLDREGIDNCFGEIAAFADIGDFLDQPVKLYSSGMYMRLAFAVQAFVPKEAMLIDEALAVGDEAFQRKCMAFLEEFKDRGGAILLVSHDTQVIVRQCERCLLLSNGRLIADDASKPVTDLYQRLMHSDPQEYEETLRILCQHGLEYTRGCSQWTQENLSQDGEAPPSEKDNSKMRGGSSGWFDAHMPKPQEIAYGNGHAEIMVDGMYNEQNKRVNTLVMGFQYRWIYKVLFYQDAHDVNFGMMLKTIDGLDVSGINTESENQVFQYIPASALMKVIFIFRLNIVPGTYFLNVGVIGTIGEKKNYLHRRVDVEVIRVVPRDSRNSYGMAYLEQEVRCIRLS